MIIQAVTDLDGEELLDSVELWAATQVQCEARVFVAAARFADLHHPDTRTDDNGRERVLPGMEQPKRLGGLGTPLVWEFAVAEFGSRIGRSPYAARALIADALDVRHRLPKLWGRVCAGEVPVRYARHVAQQTRDLSQQAAGLVDAAVAGYADGRLGWSRFETLVAGKVAEADPEAAAERERAAAEEEFARVGRSNEHGQKTLYLKSSAANLVRIDATIDYYAAALAALGDTDTEDRRRAKAVLIMANPVQAVQLLLAFAAHRANTANTPDAGADEGHQGTLDNPDDADDDTDDRDDADEPDATGEAGEGEDPVAAFLAPFRPHEIRPDSRFGCGFDPGSLLPSVTLYLHLYARTDTGEIGPVARWEGEGPITTQYVRDVLGPACRFTIKPVIDLPNMAPVDGYEVPDRHREGVHLRTPADVFPFAANTGRSKQQDHTAPYLRPDHGGPPGQTGLHNLGPLTQFHHRVKTHGSWQVKQPFPGIYLWRDPHGRCYLVDHTGTRPLAKTDSGTGLPDLTVDVYDDDPGLDCSYQRAHAG